MQSICGAFQRNGNSNNQVPIARFLISTIPCKSPENASGPLGNTAKFAHNRAIRIHNRAIRIHNRAIRIHTRAERTSRIMGNPPYWAGYISAST